MWTLGREREKDHARQFLKPGKDPALLEAVIDAVHDLMDGKHPEDAKKALRQGFTEGKAGTWESTGSWLIKAGKEFPGLLELWVEFACHPLASVRFRAAAFADELPDEVARRILPALLKDSSAKVRARAGRTDDPVS